MEFTGEGFLGFENEEQLTETLQHMLRTEPDQQETNEHTGENIVLLTENPDAEEYFTFPEELDVRKEMEGIYAESRKELPYKEWAMGRFEWKDDDAFVFTDEMFHKAFALMKKTEDTVGAVALAVAHLDQLENYIHVHFLVYPYEEEEEEA